MSNNKHLRPLMTHAASAAILHEIAHDLDTTEDTARAREAQEQFNTMCDNIASPFPQELRDQLNNAITEGNNRKITVISDAWGIYKHPTVEEIKETNADIRKLQLDLDRLESHRNDLINKAHREGISDKRIAEVEYAVK